MGTVRPMSNVVKRKKLTKRIALRIPHATWRRLVKQARLHAITPSELVREALEHYQGHLCPSLTTETVNGAIDAVTTQAIERDMAAISERTASTMAATRQAIDSLWEREHAERTAPVSSSGPTHPMAQPPGPPGGAGFASVRDPLGGKEVSVASPKRNRR
jgi:hypothetical protein